jgi:hypothetical protein
MRDAVPMLGVVTRLHFALILFAFALALATSPASAQSPTAPARPEVKQDFCPGLVAGNTPRAMPAALRMAALTADQVRLTFIGHSTFLIESPQLVRIATD